MFIDPNEIYSKYGTYIGSLSKIASQKAHRIEFILNSNNTEKLDTQDIDVSLFRALKTKNISTFAELSHMCEKDGRINILPRDDIARLIGYLDELTERHKEEIAKHNQVLRERELVRAKQNNDTQQKDSRIDDRENGSWKPEAINRQCNNSECFTIEKVLNDRKITELIHFTRIENLNSILRYGLLSVDLLCERGIRYLYNDADRWDNKTNCICTSVEFPNTANLRKYRDEYPDARWVIITIDAKVILNHECYFAEHNAATRRIKNSLESRTTAEAFEGMFASTVYGKEMDDGSVKTFSRREMRKDICCLPTSYQAEILIKHQIEKEHIMDIVFMSENDKDNYIDLIENMHINAHVFPELFNLYRNDFIFEVQ